MRKLEGLDAIKNRVGIWKRSAGNLARIITGGATTRSAEQIQHEYSTLPKDWSTLENPLLVFSRGELAVVTHREFREQYVDLIAEVVRMIGAKRVIEFGCGEGLNMGPLHERGAVEVRGFDLVAERIRRAKEQLPHIADRFWVGDATIPQVLPGSFDLAYACHAVEQMQSGWKAAIAQMRLAAGHVLLMEPFYERKGVHGKLHSRVNGYFRGTIAEVLALGFDLVSEFPVAHLDPFNPTTALLLRSR